MMISKIAELVADEVGIARRRMARTRSKKTCRHSRSRIIETRHTRKGVIRRRRICERCGARFTTWSGV